MSFLVYLLSIESGTPPEPPEPPEEPGLTLLVDADGNALVDADGKALVELA